MTRRFSGRQRAALYLVAGGRCEGCGEVLRRGWHADHVRPFSRGGATDVVNGQALCPRCNERKGDRDMVTRVRPAPPRLDEEGLRAWQQRALEACADTKGSDFFVEACPAAGKTRMARALAARMLVEGSVERVVVVCPRQQLKDQWATDAAEIGLHLDDTWRNKHLAETPDFHGMVVTYQAVAAAPEVSRHLCGRERTLVILDEIHHAGDDHAWGRTLQHAFGDATFRLALSGTPFRMDNAMIPFVRYENGVSRPDFRYGYGDAIRDGVCREVIFPSYEGRVDWLVGLDRVTYTFRDTLAETEAGKRLRGCLRADGDWIGEVLARAEAKRAEVAAAGHPNAAALCVAADQNHARDLAAILRRITGEAPTVAISDDANAHTLIEAFRGSGSRWIVAVDMVSEGVDIPRLRVAVYATTVVSPLYFRQFVGRVLRQQPGLVEQMAYVYIPADERLVTLAREIQDARDHAIETMERSSDGGEREDRQLSPDVFISSSSEEGAVIYGGQDYQQRRLAQARAVLDAAGFGYVPEAKFLELLAKVPQMAPELLTRSTPAAAVPPAGPPPPAGKRSEERAVLKDAVNRAVGRFCKRYEIDFRLVNTELMAMQQGGINELTMEQLAERLEIVQGWTREARRGGQHPFS